MFSYKLLLKSWHCNVQTFILKYYLFFLDAYQIYYQIKLCSSESNYSGFC